MKKSLLSIGLLALSFSANAQFISYVGEGAQMYVQSGALVYNGGGMKVVGSGKVENSGNVMIVGDASSKFETVNTSGGAKTDGGNFILKMTNATVGSLRYGQLYIDGLSQSNITGVVDKEYKDLKHGTYQQIAFPFYQKALSTLDAEFNKTFSNNRWSQDELLVWNNKVARFDLVQTTGTTANAAWQVVGRNANTAYFAIGSKGYNASADIKTVKGVPYANKISENMQGAAAGIDFGPNGSKRNYYRETYASYLQDAWDAPQGPWKGNFGRNIYQFGNPFFTNLDLKYLATDIPTVQGVRVCTSSVKTLPSGSTFSESAQYITYASGVAVGATNVMIKPMQTFVVKLKDANPATLDFDKLRRFAYTPKSSASAQGVTSSRNASTVKELTIIAQDENGEDLGRTYYVIYSDGVTGQPIQPSAQAASSDFAPNLNPPVYPTISTYEENVSGGIDTSVSDLYRLHINEANETDFKGKELVLEIKNANVASLKFEIKENGELISDKASSLSNGEKFYINIGGNNNEIIANNGVLPVTSANTLNFKLYYGLPTSTLSNNEVTKKGSSTSVVFDASINEYKVIFDKDWKTAKVQVFDMAGKLVKSSENVKTSSDFVLGLPKIEGVYIVTVISEKGQRYSSKIVNK
ncbi:T9SS type A sorting domain-containing protein [Bergeyella zoohelcum]|uniref:Por secretion system C-terminal sorting domain n=1 Tax=Bergeyella zoohelcum TaxID=1015 RepID=A0A376C017_9FLAO|nr:T9SS type A sorting domain-containing protein [Bergeyella zoohelcum]EKB61328.1 hypothetical protein HMPREF9700_00823 [Bergeyella zoohelcum CCUG 30536]SSZ46580.1 Por secretion system C-terminal sorting domain [Bergeyella zoohelcum]